MHQWVRRTVLIVQDFLRQACFRKARFLPGIVPPNDMISHIKYIELSMYCIFRDRRMRPLVTRKELRVI